MKNMFRSFAFVLLSIAFVLPASASDISGKAPDFTLKSRSGKNLRLHERSRAEVDRRVAGYRWPIF